MPLPRWLAKINKRVFNKREVRKGKRPVITHVGRTSGTTFRTPLDAQPVEDGYLFILMYGSGSDWVKNVMAAGTAGLRVGNDEYDLVAPRLVTKDEAVRLLPDASKLPPARLNVTEFLRMDVRT